MALISLGPIVDKIVGSIGGTTFGRSGAGQGARRRAGPADASSAAELAARNTQVYVAKQWGLLSKTDQALWNAAGAAHPLPNRLGRYRPISGFALWMQVGTNLVNAGQVLVSTPPASWTTPAVINPNVLAKLAPTITADFSASWNSNTSIDSVIVIKATGPTPWGKTPQRQQLRTVATIAPRTNPPISLGTAWSAVYGLPPQTTPYQILWEFLPYDHATGAQGIWVDFVQSTAGPNPSSPPTPATTPAAAPSVTEGLNLNYSGSTANPAWLALTTAASVTYTVVWSSPNITAAPTLQAGTSPSSLTTLHTFATTDAYTFTATAGNTYYIGMNAWSTPASWTVLFAPSQVLVFPSASLTGPTEGTLLLAEGTNARLISDVQYQGG